MDLHEWVFCASHGLELIGKRAGESRTLSPVLQLVRPFVPSPGGQMGMGLSLFPFLGVGLRSLTLPEGSLFVFLDAFGPAYASNWEALIERGLAMDATVRTRGIGLVAP